MRTSTKMIAVLLILIVIYWLIDAFFGSRPTIVKLVEAESTFIIAIRVFSIVAIIGAIALLMRKATGWWIVLAFTGFEVLQWFSNIIRLLPTMQFIFMPGVGKAVVIRAIIWLAVFVVMFVLLLRDPPSRWVREPRDMEE